MAIPSSPDLHSLFLQENSEISDPISSPSRSNKTHQTSTTPHSHSPRLRASWSLNPNDQNGMSSKNVTVAVKRKGAWRVWYKNRLVLGLFGLMCLFFFVNVFMILRIQGRPILSPQISKGSSQNSSSGPVLDSVKRVLKKNGKGKKVQNGTYGRLLALATHALAENRKEPKDLWQEPFEPASAWSPCAHQRNWEPSGGNNGYILVTANGGMNQQRVAVCNVVAVARLLNSTLVIPRFMFSSVWRDVSQFSDIYQEEHFISYLTPDVRIVKELPESLQSLDLEAIGSVVTDADMGKESKPSFFLKNILPILHKNRVVHFIGFGNRLAFDPIPFELQRVRCRCNFHALRFTPKIQKTGALLLQRLRKDVHHGLLDHYLVGPYAELSTNRPSSRAVKVPRYLALHLRFEIDMVAHSLCEYGGGEEEKKELEAYRQVHFPTLTLLKKMNRLPSPAALRSEGLCPLTPEEAVLMLAALGFNRKTYIYVAGANIYGGAPRLHALTSLYPNLVTKERLLSASELEPFKNFSSQSAHHANMMLANQQALCIILLLLDSGSQLSSLVSGFRIYYGGGRMPTIRPNKRRLADIFNRNSTIEWKVFEQRIRKSIRQTKHILERPKARSIYRYPRCKECMCLTEE